MPELPSVTPATTAPTAGVLGHVLGRLHSRTAVLGQLVAASLATTWPRRPEPPAGPLATGPVNATVRLRSADTTYGSCHTLPTTLDYGNCHTPANKEPSYASRRLLPGQH